MYSQIDYFCLETASKEVLEQIKDFFVGTTFIMGVLSIVGL